MNVNLETLTKTHGAKASSLMTQVAIIGGFGVEAIGSVGGFDISGLPDVKQKEIKKLLDLKDDVVVKGA